MHPLQTFVDGKQAYYISSLMNFFLTLDQERHETRKRWRIGLIVTIIFGPSFLTLDEERRQTKKWRYITLFVSIISIIVAIILAIVGIIVPVITTRQMQPDLSSSGMAIPD